MKSNIITCAFEYTVHFLAEKRSKSYGWYVLQVSEAKNVLGAKNVLQSQALPSLERRGA